MGPHGMTIIAISGQENSGEIAVAASTFIEGSFQITIPVCTNPKIREEFLLSLTTFYFRYRNHSHLKREIIKRLTKPNSSLINGDSICLALDDQGYTIGEKMLAENGIAPDTIFYNDVPILNKIQQVPPMPKADISVEFWLEIQLRLSYTATMRSKWRRNRFDDIPISPIEKEYYSWYESLHASLIPWKETISQIQSDLS